MNRGHNIRNVSLSESINYREEYEKIKVVLTNTEEELQALKAKYSSLPWNSWTDADKLSSLLDHTAYKKCNFNDTINLGFKSGTIYTTRLFKVIATGTVNNAPENSVTLCTSYAFIKRTIFDTNGTTYPYDSTDLYIYFESEVRQGLYQIANAIIPVKKTLKYGGNNTATKDVVLTCWPLSPSEITGQYTGEGDRYTPFKLSALSGSVDDHYTPIRYGTRHYTLGVYTGSDGLGMQVSTHWYITETGSVSVYRKDTITEDQKEIYFPFGFVI